MSELETGLPSVRQVQAFIKQGQDIELKLLTGDILSGQLRWQDQHSLCLDAEDGVSMIIWRQAVAYLKPHGEGSANRSLQVQE